MKKIISGVLAAFLCLTCSVQAQSHQQKYLNALDDWHDGDYPEALTAFKEILSDNNSDDLFEKIALQTGELYRVKELSDDGRNVRFSNDGKFAIYEKSAEDKVITYIHEVETGELFLKTEGSNLIMLDNNSVIFKRLNDDEMLSDARKKRDEGVEKAYATGDRELWRTSLNDYALVEAQNTRLILKEVDEDEKDITPNNIVPGAFIASANGEHAYLIGMEAGTTYSDIYELNIQDGRSRALTKTKSFESELQLSGDGKNLVFYYALRNSIASPSNGEAEISDKTGVMNVQTGEIKVWDGRAAGVSAEGDAVLLHEKSDEETRLYMQDVSAKVKPKPVFTTTKPLLHPVISPDGKNAAFALKDQDDYEIFTVDMRGKVERVSREIQHDRNPVFLTNDKLIAAKGEGRHQRSYMYDLSNGQNQKLFHNNTIRTIAPEYEWASSADGTKLLIVAERDGDTISPERGVYLLDLNSKITKEELESRIEENLSEETGLREKGAKLFEQIEEEVADVVGKASVNRVYTYEKELYAFDSKYISQPGNDKAAEYLYQTYKSFEYDPEYQWFTPSGRTVYDGKTANVLATLKGTTNPELVYVVSSHYDSAEDGPGADDNSSGTAALLEAARILADHPMPATIIFASFTGEEAGLLGSREFVRLAQKNGMKIVGALNNDMVGMANDSRLDNTIRYSNPGIRDIQHASAFLFTDMVTYDALYYKFTDAHAYYEAYGDIVGGIGSYPVLGNPFYHEWNDNLETINHQLVTEVAKSTAATLMLLASSPSRINGLTVEKTGENTYRVDWKPAPEKDIREYIVRYITRDGLTETVKTDQHHIILKNVSEASDIEVKAVNEQGLEGWDWAKAEVNKAESQNLSE